MLTAEEERDLVERAQAGDQRARDRLVMAFKPLVEREVRRVFRRSSAATFEDEVQVGFIGLLKALDKFDPTRGFRFATYARFWVVAEVMGYANGARNLVHLAESIAAKRAMTHLGRAMITEQRRDSGATEGEILARACEKIGVSVEVAQAVTAVRNVESLDVKMRDEEDSATRLDMLADPNDYFAAAEEEEEHEHRTRLLRAAAEELSPRSREIFDARLDKMSFRDIAFVFEVSRSRTQQIYTRAVERVAGLVTRMNPQPQPTEVR